MNSTCNKSGKVCWFVYASFLFFVGSGYPALFMVDKPANTQAAYVNGWKDGCVSGVTAEAPLRQLFMPRPFVQNAEFKSNAADELYRNGWNESFTMCRFSQGIWCSVLGLFLILSALGCLRTSRCNS